MDRNDARKAVGTHFMTIDKGEGETRVAVRAVKFERVAIVKGRSVCNSQSVKDHSR